jgi:hypothetical protein
MAASSSKGVQICAATGAGSAIIPAAVTKAKPAVLTVPSTTGAKAGDVVYIAANGTGFSEIDGKTWVLGAGSTATSFELLGSDTTASTGTLVVAPSITYYPPASMTCLCLSEFTFNPENPGTVSVATFCDPSATIPQATVSAGTVDIGGYVDITATDYKALLAMSLDNKKHDFRVTLPNNGYIMFSGTLSSFNWAVPLDGAIAYSGQVVLASKPVHLF